MTTTNLIEKRKNLEKQKNRIKQQEAFLKALERKKRTRQLIQLGGLISKAKLDHWSSNSLFGAFLAIKEKEQDKTQMNDWSYRGGVAFSATKPEVPKSPVIVKFEEPPSDTTKRSLKSLGLKWNGLRQEWEGRVILEELRTLLADQNAEIRELESVEAT